MRRADASLARHVGFPPPALRILCRGKVASHPRWGLGGRGRGDRFTKQRRPFGASPAPRYSRRSRKSPRRVAAPPCAPPSADTCCEGEARSPQAGGPGRSATTQDRATRGGQGEGPKVAKDMAPTSESCGAQPVPCTTSITRRASVRGTSALAAVRCDSLVRRGSCVATGGPRPPERYRNDGELRPQLSCRPRRLGSLRISSAASLSASCTDSPYKPGQDWDFRARQVGCPGGGGGVFQGDLYNVSNLGSPMAGPPARSLISRMSA